MTKDSWKDYREMRSTQILSGEEILARAQAAWIKNPEIACLGAIFWLWGCRFSEIISYTYSGTYKKYVFMKLPSAKVKQIWETKTPDGKVLLWGAFRRLKGSPLAHSKELLAKDEEQFRKTKREHLVPDNTIAVPVLLCYNGIKTLDWHFAEIVRKYLCDKMGAKYDIDWDSDLDIMKFNEIIMFQRSPMNYKLLIKKYFGFSPHYFRRARATYLCEILKFSVPELLGFIKWKSPAIAMNYVSSGDWSIIARMSDHVKEQYNDNEFWKRSEEEYSEALGLKTIDQIKLETEKNRKLQKIEEELNEEDKINEEEKVVPSLIENDTEKLLNESFEDFEKLKNGI